MTVKRKQKLCINIKRSLSNSNLQIVICIIDSHLSTYLLVMDPSLDSARFDSVLTRVFEEKARLGSARSLSLKARSLKKGQKRVIF